ncbi:MAG: hypothetical protein WBM08_09345 [Prochlorococcaceae cyanobacterium]
MTTTTEKTDGATLEAISCAKASIAEICLLHDSWHRLSNGGKPSEADIANETTSTDEIRQRIKELCYSVVRMSRTVEILLAGGGPMVRLVLDRKGYTLSSPRIEYATWFQPVKRYPCGRLQQTSLLWFGQMAFNRQDR